MEIPEDAIDEVVIDYGEPREKAVKRLAEVYSEGEDEVFDTLRFWKNRTDYRFSLVEVKDENDKTVYSYSE
jgi:hypothetical protein